SIADGCRSGGRSSSQIESNYLRFVHEVEPCPCLGCARTDLRRTCDCELQCRRSGFGRGCKNVAAFSSAAQNVVDNAVSGKLGQGAESTIGGVVEQLSAADRPHRSSRGPFVG